MIISSLRLVTSKWQMHLVLVYPQMLAILPALILKGRHSHSRASLHMQGEIIENRKNNVLYIYIHTSDQDQWTKANSKCVCASAC